MENNFWEKVRKEIKVKFDIDTNIDIDKILHKHFFEEASIKLQGKEDIINYVYHIAKQISFFKDDDLLKTSSGLEFEDIKKKYNNEKAAKKVEKYLTVDFHKANKLQIETAIKLKERAEKLGDYIDLKKDGKIKKEEVDEADELKKKVEEDDKKLEKYIVEATGDPKITKTIVDTAIKLKERAEKLRKLY